MNSELSMSKVFSPIMVAVVLCMCDCTPAAVKTVGVVVANAGALCVLVPVLVGGPSGPFAGSVCQDVLKIVSDVLDGLPSTLVHAASGAPCKTLVPLTRADGTWAGAMCSDYATDAQKALQ